MNKKNKYEIAYYIICVIAAAFFMTIGYQIINWQWWAGNALIWSAAWCGMHMTYKK